MLRRALLAGLLSTAIVGCGGGSASSTPTPLSSGMDVYTVAGPTCPVQSQGQTCTAPVSATVVVTQSGATRATVTTSSNGRGHIPLPPGVYTLTGQTSSRFPRAPGPRQVTVYPGQFIAVQLAFDTGIR